MICELLSSNGSVYVFMITLVQTFKIWTFKYGLCLYILTNKQTNYHCMILIDIFVVLSKLFALIKFIVTYDCDVNFHLFFKYLFGIFAEIRQTFRRSVFSARWLFGKMLFRRSGFRQSVVHRKESVFGIRTLTSVLL